MSEAMRKQSFNGLLKQSELDNVTKDATSPSLADVPSYFSSSKTSLTTPRELPELKAERLDIPQSERTARRIARIATEQITELALIGHATDFAPETRDVVETVVFLVARDVLEEVAA